MKRILWAGLLIFSLNSFAFLEDEEAREKINDLQNQLNSLKTEKLVDLEGKITDLQQVLQGGSLQQFNNKINEIFDDLAKLRGDVEVCNLVCKVLKIDKNSIIKISKVALKN
jgi:hypothetical protein